VSEIRMAIRKIDSWSKPRRVRSVFLNFPSSSKIYNEPYGNILIVSPWNYPYQLSLAPLIGAVAAGNTVVLKPSELAPHTSRVIRDIIESVFDKSHVAVVEGGADVSQALLSLRWDYIFFTGSALVGKIVAKAAAAFLTPVTLELGGKNPCVVDETANLEVAARRIAWGKFLNAGQTCIAPDYVLIHESVKSDFIRFLRREVFKMYGENPKESPDLSRIINKKHWHRLMDTLEDQKILFGGQGDEQDKYLAPTLVDEPDLGSNLMKGEIFGPILPLLSYSSESDLANVIALHGKPLALYVFSNSKYFSKKIINEYSFGGGVVNDTIVHFANHRLPFGGVGDSGMGKYHGKSSFDTFSHSKGVVVRSHWLDLPIRYAPYAGKIKIIKTLLDYVQRISW